MDRTPRLLFVFVCLTILLLSATALARPGTRLMINGDDVVVYSGPSPHYRPLLTAAKGDTFPVSPRRVINKGAEFFKILVTIRGGGKRVGYVAVSDPVNIESYDTDEDVDTYQPLQLARSSVQFSFGGLRDRNYVLSIGYLRYPAPNFYVKAFGGQIITPATGNFLAGGEAGLDHLLKGNLSIYGLVNAGVALPASSGAIFAGSGSLCEFIQSGFGFRYSAAEYASVSLGMIQSGFFNNNNSLLSSGYLITLEVGL